MKADDKSMEFQILEAAEKLFLKQGYAKTSTGQIAKLVGCNQALVHYYYRTKDNLFEKVFEEKVGMIAANILNVGEKPSNIEERIAQIVGFHFNFLKQNPMLPQFVLNEISSNPTRLQSLVDRLKVYMIPVLTQLEAELKREIEKGTVRPIRATDLLITILSLNIMPFLTKPVLQRALNIPDGGFEEMLEQRQKEAVETVLSRLRV